KGVMHRQLVVVDLTGKAMGLEQTYYRPVDQRSAIDGGDHVVFTVQASDQGDHRLSSRFPISPIIQTLLVLGLSHSSSFQVMGAKGPTLCGQPPREAITRRQGTDARARN